MPKKSDQACAAQSPPTRALSLNTNDWMRAAARRWARGLALLAAVAPAAQALGLGIGEQSQVSRLFEPLRVEIPLQLDGLAPDDVQVELGLDAIDSNAGIRPAGRAALQREIVVDAAGHALLRVSAADPVREPMLRLHVDLSSASLHVWRDLTLLFDPANSPQPAARAAVTAQAAADVQARPREAAPVSAVSAPAAEKPAPGRPAVAAGTTRKQAPRAQPAPQREAGGMRLMEQLSTGSPARGTAPAAPVAAVENRPARLTIAESLTPDSQALLRVVNPDAGALALASAPPAALVAPAAPAKVAVGDEKRAPFFNSLNGLLLGLLAIAALAFGWLFRSVRVVQARRPLESSPSGRSLAGWTSASELSDTLLEPERRAPQQTPPLPAHEAVVVEFVEPAEPAPAASQAAPAAEAPTRKPLQAFADEWSPEEFDLSQPVDEPRVNRR